MSHAPELGFFGLGEDEGHGQYYVENVAARSESSRSASTTACSIWGTSLRLRVAGHRIGPRAAVAHPLRVDARAPGASRHRRESGARFLVQALSVFGDLQHYCEAQYRSVDALCRVNRQYLENLTREALEGDAEANPEPAEPTPPSRSSVETLPITLGPPSPDAFRNALLRERRAWIVEIRRDARKVERFWDARNMSLSSNVFGNLRSRSRFRTSAWKRLGIQSLVVSIKRP